MHTFHSSPSSTAGDQPQPTTALDPDYHSNSSAQIAHKATEKISEENTQAIGGLVIGDTCSILVSQCLASLSGPPQNTSEAASLAIKLSKLEALKNDFLNTISHELRTPLSNIYLSVQLLEILLQRLGITAISGQFSSNDLTQILACLHTVRDECKREIDLVDDLLMIQQLESDPPRSLPVRLSLEDWFMDLMPTLRAIADHHHQRLEIELPHQPGCVVTDPALVGRIITELITNACKFTPADATIVLAVRTPPNQLEVIIQNPGDPIPPEDTPHIFDKFRRIPGADPWKRGGIGIGLTLAQRLARHLDGVVWLERVEANNQFTLSLPCEHTSATIDGNDLLMNYVAYYLSLGKAIESRGDRFSFTGKVYQYWGLHPDFLQFWQRLQQRPDFNQLCLEKDIYSFGQFLSKSCTVQQCSHCRQLVPIKELGMPHLGGCGLCERNGDDHSSPLDALAIAPPTQAPSLTAEQEADSDNQPPYFLIVGQPTNQDREQQDTFARNGIQVCFVAAPERLDSEVLRRSIELIILRDQLSRQDGELLARQLRCFYQLQEVPIMAFGSLCLSRLAQVQHSNPLEDYILAPLAGHHLAHHLRRLSQEPTADPLGLYWFPC